MLEKIDKIQELLNVPNVDSKPETAITNMKILNLLVSLRADAEQLNLSDVGNWVTFENNPPSEDGRYLLKQNEAVYIADYYKESDIWQDDHYNIIMGVDYWMHLPE